ncbi:alpha/beta-hydrolase [Lepidopterella palustris CBS 459.81]|uniref:Alpha/beta-hydrolase n=1 Tax=Lepidopterella palustris CBS 459.81 TaxID=1314670 RepID=A0A8E2EHJ7_9PEZI|nr:alpha/beta-hydrolase [Lepidopterella palustris CBS 459.81]
MRPSSEQEAKGGLYLFKTCGSILPFTTDGYQLLRLWHECLGHAFYVFVFKNIRFAAPPVGDLRWEKPAPPLVQTGIQDGSSGFVCIQRVSSSPDSNSSQSASSDLTSQFFSLLSAGNQSEDCLFLDVYVPGNAIRGWVKNLPVVVWIYGGSYSAGSKDGAQALGLYDGTGLISASGGNIIVVVPNYRLGAYGFLSGKTVENEGIANAGLHDQYSAFEWVNKYISLVGGDPSDVSAWGESAGAGSIYWLLTQEGGTKDPLFHRAIIQSAAFDNKFDRYGTMEQDFQTFATLAGCGGQGLACLRAANASTLQAVNAQFISSSPTVFGPAPDGKYFHQHPTVEYSQGNYWKEITSLIPSHTIDEAAVFVMPTNQTDADFTAYLNRVWPPYAVAAVFKTEIDRQKALFSQSAFLCRIHVLTTAYAGKTHNVHVLGAPTPLWAIIGGAGVSKAYQSYLVSHARTGDPNTYRDILNIPPTIEWPPVGNLQGEYYTNVLNVSDSGFDIIQETEYNKTICEFWVGIYTNTTNLGGYAPD